VDQPAQPISVRPLELGSPTVQFDQMQNDLKRIRQDADQLTASLRQLELQNAENFYGPHLPNSAWVFGVQGLLLGLGVLMVGALLAWKMPSRALASARSKPGDFMESALYLSDMEPVAAPIEQLVVGAVSCEPQSRPVTPTHAESTTDLQPQTSQFSEDLLAPETAHGFDFKAAASDVERVRKSLAEKRAERVRLRHKLPVKGQSWPFVDSTSAVQTNFTRPAQPVGAKLRVDYMVDVSEPIAELHLSTEKITSAVSMDIALDFDEGLSQEPSEPVFQRIRSAESDTPDSEAMDAALLVKLALAQA
jgi:hypothetical protein